MAEIIEDCKFETRTDQVRFTTMTNGDRVTMRVLELSQEQATSLAWLINSPPDTVLKWRVRVKISG